MAEQDTVKIIDGYIFHNLSKAKCVKFLRYIPAVVDHLKVHFQ